MIDLTPQQIKDNAPSGATHYEMAGNKKPYPIYWKFNDDGMFMWQDLIKKWTRFRFMSRNYINKTKPL